MYSSCVLVLALAVFGASATLVTPGYVLNGGCGNFATPVSDVCSCVKTVVRPQIRTEITAVPTVQRFVRTEATPVVERIPYLVNRRVNSAGYLNGGLGGVRGFSGLGSFGGAGVGVLSGVSAISSGYGY